MIVAITGSRANVPAEIVHHGLSEFIRSLSHYDAANVQFRVGDAGGVDTFVRGWMTCNFFKERLIVYCASDEKYVKLTRSRFKCVSASDWNREGPKAGLIRNAVMLRGSEKLIKFWDGQSPGTRSCADVAEQQGIEVIDGILLAERWLTGAELEIAAEEPEG